MAKILVVDDTISNTLILKHILSDYEVTIAHTGRQALELVEHFSPDLVLLDILLPDIDGYEVCKQLKNDDSLKDVPVVFVTSVDGEEAEAVGLELGAADYITKPFNQAIVRARVRNLVTAFQHACTLEKLTITDELTGIFNRRHLEAVLDTEIRRSTRTRTSLSVFMIDIDYFKKHNDTYGHSAGDVCLQKVAQAMSTVLTRAGDSLFRYGGEEFTAVLPATDYDSAMLVGNRVCQCVQDLKIENSGSFPYITVSVGSVTKSLELPITNNLLSEADKMLYLAKESGRNRCCGKYLS